MDATRLGECLRSQRHALGWSQELLAEHSGVSIRTIRNLETGASQNPRRSSLGLIADALHEGWLRRGENRDISHLLAGALDSTNSIQSGQTQAAGIIPDRCWRGMRPPQDELVTRDGTEALTRSLRQRRFLVLTGATGIGKTRLALTIAERLWSHYLDGVAVVELAGLTAATTDDVLGAVQPMLPSEDSFQLLLILDNAEQIIDSVAAASRHLLTRHPQLDIIVTSQRPVHGGDCWRWEVPPLSTHTAPGSPSEAASLLIARTAVSAPGLDLTDQLDQVEQLCAWLDGNPQAIEVAAAQLRCLPLEILRREEAIRVILNEPTVLGLSHGRTLGAGIASSISLLEPEHRDALSALAVSGNDLDIQRAVELITPIYSDAIAALARLVDSTLLQVARASTYTYRISPSVRSCLLAST